MAGGGNQDENPVAINVVAMVDIIFCLCLFFMCSLKFRPLDAKFESWMPKNVGSQSSAKMNEPLDEIRVVMSYDVKANQIQRLFGQNSCPAGEDGDKKLTALIQGQYKTYKANGRPDVPLIIDAGPAVPWEPVVHVVDLGRDAGVIKVQFAMSNVVDK